MEKSKYAVQTNLSNRLKARLSINNQVSVVDFQQWVQDQTEVPNGSDVLDVGCGTGEQSLRFLNRVGESGSVYAIDSMESSITQLLENEAAGRNLIGKVGDMMDLRDLINDRRFNVAASTYAIYYARNPGVVLKTMYDSLKPGGHLMICVPQGPHGLVELVRRYKLIPSVVLDSLSMGRQLLEPFFDKHFDSYSISFLKNQQSYKDINQVMSALTASPYYDDTIETDVRRNIESAIEAEGCFQFYKRSFLITAQLTDV